MTYELWTRSSGTDPHCCMIERSPARIITRFLWVSDTAVTRGQNYPDLRHYDTHALVPADMFEGWWQKGA